MITVIIIYNGVTWRNATRGLSLVSFNLIIDKNQKYQKRYDIYNATRRVVPGTV